MLRPSAPNPWLLEGPGRGGKEPHSPGAGPSLSHRLCPLLPSSSPGSRGPYADRPFLKGWGFMVGIGLLPTAKDWGSGFQQGSSKNHLFIFHSCHSNVPFAQAEDGWISEEREYLGTDPPGNSLCTLLRLVRSNLTINSTELEMYESVKVATGWFLASPWGSELRPSVLCKGPGAGQREGTGILPGARSSAAHPAEVCQGTGLWVCAQYRGPLRFCGLQACLCVWSLCPPFESVHAGVGS